MYKEDERAVLHAQRPVVLNGIEEFMRKSDLIDRTVFLHMRSISQKKRRDEEEIWRSFRADQPLILGSVLDAIVGGVARAAGCETGANAAHGGLCPMGSCGGPRVGLAAK